MLVLALESEGFTVYEAEWWHFDYRDWQKYPIMNVRFETIVSFRITKPTIVRRFPLISKK